MHRARASIVAAVILLIATTPAVVRAAAPSNDDPATATVIDSLPFSVVADLTEATNESPEFMACESFANNRIWYRHTPTANQTISVSTNGYAAAEIALWVVGSDLADLTLRGCGSFGGDLIRSLAGGTTYLISVGMMDAGAPFAGTVTFEVVPPPANDDMADAFDISDSMPFTTSLSATSGIASTFEPGETPASCGFDDQGPFERSVWYALTPPGDTLLLLNDSIFEFFGVYEGAVYPGATEVACSRGSAGSIVPLSGGQAYLLQVGPSIYGGTLLNLGLTLPPANDAFADAATITELPANLTVDLTYATSEPGEPEGCGNGGDRSLWYEYTATEDASLLLTFSDYWAFTAIYTGSSLDGLTEVVCSPGYGGPTAVSVTEGVTYRIQAASYSAYPMLLQLQVTPPPNAGFDFSPFPPSSLDPIQFFDTSSDPAGRSWTWRWDFGDGATSSQQNPVHDYLTDGTYQVSLTIETTDGRTGSYARDILVQTHDVAIKKLGTPVTASAGQKRQITVSVTNVRYPELVTVSLWATTSSGQLYLGDITKNVLTRGTNRPTDFTFEYRFTPADAVSGKITFTAYATLLNARDVFPSDNTLSGTTRVTR